MTALIEGLVVAHLGKGLSVESDEKTILCHTRRQLGTAAVGDRVLWQPLAEGQGRVMKILPRRSVLMRPLRNGKTRPVAANIDKVFVVFAVEPPCDFLLIDQYLAICENRHIEAVLVLNKMDLFCETRNREIAEELRLYSGLGYQLIKVSAKNNMGLNCLRQAIANRTGILTGQSGVGKSSLTNALIPDRQLKTNSLSSSSGQGRHTTTAATLYHLPEGGNLIDSPGVAIFGLAGISEQQLAYGYREFQPLIGECQFSNCKHVRDKGCAIRNAMDQGKIAASRYQRFLKLREKMTLY